MPSFKFDFSFSILTCRYLGIEACLRDIYIYLTFFFFWQSVEISLSVKRGNASKAKNYCFKVIL